MAFSSLRGLTGAVLLTAASCLPAMAQIDPLGEVLSGIGITSRDRPQIDYRERAPLVVPKTGGGLRPPEERSAARGQRWPNDPDIAARRRRAEEARLPPGSFGQDDETEGRIIRDSKARNRFAGVPTQGQGGGDGGYNPARAVSPEQLRQIQASAIPDATPVGGEPRREVLTDPPRGYRRATGPKVKATVEPMRSGDDLQINLNAPRN